VLRPVGLSDHAASGGDLAYAPAVLRSPAAAADSAAGADAGRVPGRVLDLRARSPTRARRRDRDALPVGLRDGAVGPSAVHRPHVEPCGGRALLPALAAGVLLVPAECQGTGLGLLRGVHVANARRGLDGRLL